jgi:hypothetical protein
LTGLKLNTILNYPNAIRERTKEIADLGGKLFVREFPTGSATIITLRNHIKQFERDQIVPDVIFVDYADIMKPISSLVKRCCSPTTVYSLS